MHGGCGDCHREGGKLQGAGGEGWRYQAAQGGAADQSSSQHHRTSQCLSNQRGVLAAADGTSHERMRQQLFKNTFM